MSGGPWVMPPQPSGNGTQFAGDDSTQLLAPVGHDSAIRYVLSPSPLKGRYVYSPQDQPTAVIPVTPAQPQPITDGEPYNEHPWCRKRLEAMGVLVCAGMVLAAALLVAGIVIGAVVF